MKSKLPTGKSLGFKKGDFVYTGMFPGIVVSRVNTYAPVIEAWGIAHECGGTYASDLRKMDLAAWRAAVEQLGHKFPLKAYYPEAKAALEAAYGVTAAAVAL